MKLSHTLLFLFCAWLLLGCRIGGDIAKLPIANQPEGEHIQVLMKGNWYVYGEFIALKEQSMIVLADSVDRYISKELTINTTLPAVAEIPLDKIGSARMVEVNHAFFKGGKFSRYKNIDPRYFSRYPQDIDSAILKSLLESNQQDSLWVI